MTVILKRQYAKLLPKKFKTQKEKNIVKTHLFSKKNNINICYKKIDFLKIKLLKEDNYNLRNIEFQLIHPTISQDIYNSEIKEVKNKKILFEKFFVVYAWLVYGNQKKLYDIYDFDKNKIWQIVLKNEVPTKSNKNVIDSIEFSWLFFKCYEKYLDHFLKYFRISKNRQDLVKRLDYCIDIEWLEVFQLIAYIKELHRKTKNIYGLSATDIKAISHNSTNIKYWKQEIYVNFFSAHNDLKIYDKILDILQNYRNRKVDGKNPYQSYLDSDNPIIRIELKKKKFQNLRDNSINWVLDNIQALFFDYLLKYFEVDFSYYVWKDLTLNWKQIFLAKEEKEKSLFHAYTMAKAYLWTIEDFVWEDWLQHFMHEISPSIVEKNHSYFQDELDWLDIKEILPKE